VEKHKGTVFGDGNIGFPKVCPHLVAFGYGGHGIFRGQASGTAVGRVDSHGAGSLQRHYQ